MSFRPSSNMGMNWRRALEPFRFDCGEHLRREPERAEIFVFGHLLSFTNRKDTQINRIYTKRQRGLPPTAVLLPSPESAAASRMQCDYSATAVSASSTTTVSAQQSAHLQSSHLHSSHFSAGHLQSSHDAQFSHFAALAQLHPSQTHFSQVHTPSAHLHSPHLHSSQGQAAQHAVASAATVSVSITCTSAAFLAFLLPHAVITKAAIATMQTSVNFFMVFKF